MALSERETLRAWAEHAVSSPWTGQVEVGDAVLNLIEENDSLMSEILHIADRCDHIRPLTGHIYSPSDGGISDCGACHALRVIHLANRT